MTKPVMKSLKLNPENDMHRQAIEVLNMSGKKAQTLIVKLLVEHGKKSKSNLDIGDLFDEKN